MVIIEVMTGFECDVNNKIKQFIKEAEQKGYQYKDRTINIEKQHYEHRFGPSIAVTILMEKNK